MSPHSLRRHAVALACLATLAAPALAQQAAAEQAKDTTLPRVSVKAKADAGALPEAAAGGQAATGARLGLLGNTEALDAPFSVNAYTQQAIQDQQARTLADVLQNDPSVRFTTNSGHMIESFRIRGLDVNNSDVAFNGLYGVAPIGHVPTEFLERVEVLRGPNALLGGMAPSASLGGMINLVPKRATDKPVTDVTASFSSQSYGQLHVDLGRRFGDDQRLGVRFNGVYGDGETGVAGQEKGRRLGALALDWQGDRFNVVLDAYSSRETIDNGSPVMVGITARRGNVVGVGHLVDVPDADTNLFKGTYGTYEDTGYALRGEWNITDAWRAHAAVGGVDSTGKGLMFGTRVIVTADDGTAVGYVYNVHTFNKAQTAELGLTGRFATGGVRHTLALGLNQVDSEDGSANVANQGWAQNIYDPVAPVFPAAPTSVATSNDNTLRSVAVADTLDIANGRVLVTLGARWQEVDQKLSGYQASRLSPSLGAVFKPFGPDVSFYANCMEGLTPGQTVGTGYANEGQTFAPIQTRQFEAGVKLRHGKFQHSLAAFQIERPTLVLDTATNRLDEGGKQRVQGLEWNSFGQPLADWSVLGGVTVMNAKQVNTGLDSYGVPDWTVNLGADWATPLTGLSLAGRAVATGPQWVDSANTVRLPTSHRFDVGAKYVTRVVGTPLTLNAFVENVTGRNEWVGMFSDGYVMAGAPRTLRLAATASF